MSEKFFPNDPPKQLETGESKTLDPKEPPKQLVPPLFGFGRADQPGVEGGSAFSAQPGVVGTNGDGGDGVFGESINGVGVHGRGGRLAAYSSQSCHPNRWNAAT